jgi:hypothetical protein
LLSRIPRLGIDEELCQEDWGVVLFARREKKKFWVGLSMWEGPQSWLAHFHHGSFAWAQRLSSSGGRELQRLLCDVHGALASDPAVSDIRWYEENQWSKARPPCYLTPVED